MQFLFNYTRKYTILTPLNQNINLILTSQILSEELKTTIEIYENKLYIKGYFNQNIMDKIKIDI